MGNCLHEESQSVTEVETEIKIPIFSSLNIHPIDHFTIPREEEGQADGEINSPSCIQPRDTKSLTAA